MSWGGPINQIDDFRFEIPQSYKKCMRTSSIIFTDIKMMSAIRADNAL
jgi:hypothetical protein